MHHRKLHPTSQLADYVIFTRSRLLYIIEQVLIGGADAQTEGESRQKAPGSEPDALGGGNETTAAASSKLTVATTVYPQNINDVQVFELPPGAWATWASSPLHAYADSPPTGECGASSDTCTTCNRAGTRCADNISVEQTRGRAL